VTEATAPDAPTPPSPGALPDGLVENQPKDSPRVALVVLGACTALAVTMLSDSVLLPELDQPSERMLGLTTVATLLSVGWWMSSWRAHVVKRSLVLLVGGSLLLGGGLSLLLTELMHKNLVMSFASAESPVPFGLIIPLHVAIGTASYIVPLGALLGIAFGAVRRHDAALLMLGAGGAFALAPVLGEEWFGRSDTLMLLLVFSAATAVSLLRRTPWSSAPAKLASGSAFSLLILGAIATMADQLSRPHVDLGTNDTAWFAATICLAASAGASLPGRSRASSFDLFIPLAAVSLFLARPSGRIFPTIEPSTSLARLACVAVPLGVVMGMALARRGTRRPVSWTPVLLLLGGTITGLWLLPSRGALSSFVILSAATLLAALLNRPWPHPARILMSLALATVIFSMPLPGPLNGPPIIKANPSPSGHTGWMADPTNGRSRMVIDGVSALSRHELQEHRLVHIPSLLQGAPHRILLIAADAGEAEAVALEHKPAELDWLRPAGTPEFFGLNPMLPGQRRFNGGERLFFESSYLEIQAGLRSRYQLIVLLPDLQVRRRAGLHATREFYAAAERLLASDGLFCQWWDPAFIHPEDLLSALASANSVFTSATLITDHPRSRRPLIGLVGTRRQLKIRPRDILAQMQALPELKAEFDSVGLDPLLVSCLIGPSPDTVALLAPDHMALTDARPGLGARGGRRHLPIPENTLAVRDLVAVNRSDPMQWTQVRKDHSGVAIAQTRAIHEAWTALFKAARATLLRFGEETIPFEAEKPGTFLDRKFLLQAYDAAPDWPYLERLVLERFDHLEQSGAHEHAENWLREALELDFRSVRLRMELAQVMERQENLAEAEVLYKSILALTPEHPDALIALERLGSS